MQRTWKPPPPVQTSNDTHKDLPTITNAPILRSTMVWRWMMGTPGRQPEESPYRLPIAMMPDHPNHHSPGPSKDTQGRSATISSNPASPRQNGKEKVMLSIFHTLTRSAYKTFQANPGVTTFSTPQNIGTHRSQSPPTESPTDRSPAHTSYLSGPRPAGERASVHRSSPAYTMRPPTPKPNQNVPHPFPKWFD